MYPIAELGDIVNVKGGKRLPKGEQLVLQKTPHPYIRAQDIRGGRVTFDQPMYVSEAVFPKIKEYTVDTNDCVSLAHMGHMRGI